ncbi:uncharacterized protein LOC124447415 isoform X2 [Xenia sp. Carnegie-2017]|uniref:uncharacterized protein LOC124447415 isoform X2 n=1 Tax=Xenia sp. Carnegie-2017 TaxID=2897299 RepID=UPI001F038B26|nr:uncharacterized protein LOC124447415 isoform X2 [Xenia sp. Carnegie-2017]
MHFCQLLLTRMNELQINIETVLTLNMNVICFSLITFTCFYATTQAEIFRVRQDNIETRSKKGESIYWKTGIPLVFEKKKNGFVRTEIPEQRDHVDKEENDSHIDKSKKSYKLEKDKKRKKNPEELGQGYEKINMGSNNIDDDNKNDEVLNKGSKKIKKKYDSKTTKKGKNSLSLNGEFPPNADEVKNLPKDEELTPLQADKKLEEKRKGYVHFTIMQKFKPELKYKESAAYKILAGNVMKDVNRALRTANVVQDVLFSEAKNVGAPPYRSKVEVYLKLNHINYKKLKKMVDYGLINGMITIPGSFTS